MFLFIFVPFWCLVFDMFWCCTVLDLVISTYFNHVNGAKCLIHINLCTESDLFPFFLFMYLKEKQYKIAMILLCPVQGPWASSFYLLPLYRILQNWKKQFSTKSSATIALSGWSFNKGGSRCSGARYLGDNTSVSEWLTGINCIILLSRI